jgi:hypothetical protein
MNVTFENPIFIDHEGALAIFDLSDIANKIPANPKMAIALEVAQYC